MTVGFVGDLACKLKASADGIGYDTGLHSAVVLQAFFGNRRREDHSVFGDLKMYRSFQQFNWLRVVYQAEVIKITQNG